MLFFILQFRRKTDFNISIPFLLRGIPIAIVSITEEKGIGGYLLIEQYLSGMSGKMN
ncbi:Uncharacterised protein [Vibrio cholerae]|nr:Uncharacterised protein [Vibrio cholerae]CSB20922.1 Uncharacterised protein [Vibrio cholerae]CSC64723.1 Uncharacterised protein [Vibrio cholerae]CSI54857.1 Uncharacterised protein [Vibrio cholerae]